MENLCEIRKHRREGKNNVNEMYVQQSCSVQSCWQSEEEPEVLTKRGTSQRLIIVHWWWSRRVC